MASKEKTRLYWIHTLSPTHVGTGRGVGYIDLPIQREKVTNWPIIPGSAFKGVWADAFRATEAERHSNKKLALAFGTASDSDPTESNSGALIPTDARLVCLPVRSFNGTFAWCTSSLALSFFHRDLAASHMQGLPEPPPPIDDDKIHHPAGSALTHDDDGHGDGRLYLEDLDFEAQQCETAKAWAEFISQQLFPDEDSAEGTWRKIFTSRFAVLPNSVFDFLTETGTEVVTRVRIDDELKTVAEGQLWNEEALPAETILYGVIQCDRVFSKNGNSGISEQNLLQEYATKPQNLQIGGKATTGRGRVRCLFSKVQGEDA